MIGFTSRIDSISYSSCRICVILTEMSKQILLFLILAIGIISLASLLVIGLSISPYSASREIMWAFFISLQLFLTSFFSLLWHNLKRLFIYRFSTPSLWPSVRQAAILAAIIVLSTFFNSLGILALWDIIPLSISAVLFEFFFQADKSRILAHESPQ